MVRVHLSQRTDLSSIPNQIYVEDRKAALSVIAVIDDEYEDVAAVAAALRAAAGAIEQGMERITARYAPIPKPPAR